MVFDVKKQKQNKIYFGVWDPSQKSGSGRFKDDLFFVFTNHSYQSVRTKCSNTAHAKGETSLHTAQVCVSGMCVCTAERDVVQLANCLGE